MLYEIRSHVRVGALQRKGVSMPNEEETRLRSALTDSQVLRLAASCALTSAVYGVGNYLKLVDADATASEGYLAARVALRAYRMKHKLI